MLYLQQSDLADSSWTWLTRLEVLEHDDAFGGIIEYRIMQMQMPGLWI